MSENKKADVASVNTIVNGVYTLVPQTSLNARGQKRFSRLFVRLVTVPSGRVGDISGKINDTNWELSDESATPILEGYTTGRVPVPDGLVAEYYGETGQDNGKTLRSAPTYVSVGKNLGKKNATNIVQQAINEAQTKWNKNARKGGYVVESESSLVELGSVQSGRVKPMALHEFPPQPTDGKFDITGTSYWVEGQEMYMSIKYDGNRLTASVNLSRSPTVDLWGRGGDEPPNPLTHIRTQLEILMQAQSSSSTDASLVTFDGEIWAPNVPHQQIHHMFSNAAADSSALGFYIFDIVDPVLPFKQRYATLKAMLEKAPEKYPGLHLVTETLVSKSAQIEKIYKEYLTAGHEGAVLRLPDGLYEPGTRKEIRSKAVLKLKPVHDSEFEISGYKSGEGRDADAIIWVLKMPNGREFSARPAETLEERRKLFTEMATKFETDYKGKMLRISYGDTTALGVPRFPRVIGVREQIA